MKRMQYFCVALHILNRNCMSAWRFELLGASKVLMGFLVILIFGSQVSCRVKIDRDISVCRHAISALASLLQSHKDQYADYPDSLEVVLRDPGSHDLRSVSLPVSGDRIEWVYDYEGVSDYLVTHKRPISGKRIVLRRDMTIETIDFNY